MAGFCWDCSSWSCWRLSSGRKLVTALLTWRALALTPVLSRRLSKWVKSYDYADEEFLRADGAGEPWVELRKKAIDRLAMFFQTQYAKSIAWGNDIRESFSDLRFTDANRVPFPFMRVMREKFNLCSVVTASTGTAITRSRWALDPGCERLLRINVAGFERYKEWMQKGWERVQGPWAGFGASPPRGGRQHCPAQIRFAYGRSVLSYEWH